MFDIEPRINNRAIWSEKKRNVYFVNEDFFSKWSPNMAYVLGFFAADGCLTLNSKRGNKYVEFVSTDREIIEKIKCTLESEHKIGIKIPLKNNWQIAYRLQIGSKKMFQDLTDLGFMPKKSKIVKFPLIPREHVSHFIRGYFDGDGHCNFYRFNRKDRPGKGRVIIAGFTSGSKDFLEGLQRALIKYSRVGKGTLCFSNGYRLNYSTRSCIKLFDYLYKDKNLYLKRKFDIFNQAIKLWGRSSAG